MLQRVDELPAGARAVLQVVRLIDDDHVVMLARRARLACSRRRAVAIEAITRGCAQKAGGSLRSSASWLVANSISNLRRHLVPPLPDQRRRRQDQHALGHAAQQVFFEHHPGLDRLAEADLVGEQHAAAELLEHLAHGLDLVPVGLDAAQRAAGRAARRSPARGLTASTRSAAGMAPGQRQGHRLRPASVTRRAPPAGSPRAGIESRRAAGAAPGPPLGPRCRDRGGRRGLAGARRGAGLARRPGRPFGGRRGGGRPATLCALDLADTSPETNLSTPTRRANSGSSR